MVSKLPGGQLAGPLPASKSGLDQNGKKFSYDHGLGNGVIGGICEDTDFDAFTDDDIHVLTFARHSSAGLAGHWPAPICSSYRGRHCHEPTVSDATHDHMFA